MLSPVRRRNEVRTSFSVAKISFDRTMRQICVRLSAGVIAFAFSLPCKGGQSHLGFSLPCRGGCDDQQVRGGVRTPPVFPACYANVETSSPFRGRKTVPKPSCDCPALRPGENAPAHSIPLRACANSGITPAPSQPCPLQPRNRTSTRPSRRPLCGPVLNHQGSRPMQFRRNYVLSHQPVFRIRTVLTTIRGQKCFQILGALITS